MGYYNSNKKAETGSMEYLDLHIKQNNQSLESSIKYGIGINILYKKHGNFSPVVDAINMAQSMNNNTTPKNANCKKTNNDVRRGDIVRLTLVPLGDFSNNLTLDEHLKTKDGQRYVCNSTLKHRCLDTVEEEGRRLINLYALNADKLTEEFEKEFNQVLLEDFGYHEFEMLEFFFNRLQYLEPS